MLPERWKQIEVLYYAALEISGQRREQLLASADPEIRVQVEKLLAQESSGAILDLPAWEGGLNATGTMIEPGVQFGPYRLEAKLGEGGMGQVFLAEDTRLKRKVALKLLIAHQAADAELKMRFLQEARAVSALKHPNIVILYDISKHGASDFLVMEFVAGKTLRDMIPSHGLPPAQVASIGAQVASALAAAHAAGLVHRDIKPANIMVADDGTVKVLDFGIAKPVDLPLEKETGWALTSPGMLVGTASYMSPEQTRGEKVDGRSDIFSLGAVLYQAATGSLPFKGSSLLGLMQAIAEFEPAPPSMLRPELPGWFDALVARCMAKRPGERPASAADLAVELRGAAMAEPSTGTKPRRISVAVVPFLFRGASAEDEFLPVSLADALVERLSSAGELLVRPVASVVRYAGKDADWTEVARDLNVDMVVGGTVQRVGRKIRILTRVHRVGQAQAIYSGKFDGDLDDLFVLQDRLCDGIQAGLRPLASASREFPREAADSVSPAAYELFLRAAERVTRLNKWDTQSAIEMLTRATGIDPSFTEAWARLAQACVQMGVIFDGDPRWFVTAEEAIAKTLALDVSHSGALCARGQILWSPHHSYQNQQALRALNGALRLNPECHVAQIWRGLILFHLGLYAEAKEGLLQALAQHPEDPRVLVFLGHTALYRGDYEEAYDFNRRALTADPTSIWPNIFFPTIPLYLDRPGEAVEHIHTARKMVPDEPTLISVEAMVAAHDGQFQKAERLANEALSHKKSLLHTHHLWHYAASAFAMCGKPDLAVPLLRRCSDMGLPNYLLFDRDPHLMQLRGNPDFDALQVHLRAEYNLFRAEFGTVAI
jgi:serine/threonine protein kinase/tetratricopeptide (TPR) repeat protein